MLSWGVLLAPWVQSGLLLGENCTPVWIYRDVSGNSHPEWSVAGAEDPGLGGGDSNTMVKGFFKKFIKCSEVKVLAVYNCCQVEDRPTVL